MLVMMHFFVESQAVEVKELDLMDVEEGDKTFAFVFSSIK